VANPSSLNGFRSWKEGDFGAFGYGKLLELKIVDVDKRSAGLLEGFDSKEVAPNKPLRDWDGRDD
jgi:hypothetical protein